jgi:exopolyphosphatase / guanosine-5'-triphosphate,3'-diphosphate pyrophosphatase
MMLRRSSPTAKSATFEPHESGRETGAQGRLGSRVPVAVIDIGSNSVRQVIYEGLTRAPAVLFNEKVLCGLGKGIATTGSLEEGAVECALSAIRRFLALGRQADVGETYILATAASRDAANGPDFIARVERLAGAKVTVLTGQMEAQYSAWGVKAGFHKPNGIVGDMGGGSLELVAVNGSINGGITLPLGGLRLAEVSGNSLVEARRIARTALRIADVSWPGRGRTFFAVGGTWRSLAKLHIEASHYPLNAVHDYEVDADRLVAFCNRVVAKPVETIKGIDVVSRNRRSLLQYGALVMAETVRALGAESVAMSSMGVREGYLYSLLPPEEQEQDSLIVAARDLSILRARSPRHSEELAEWSGRAFKTLGMEETENEARYRVASCYLADIAWRAHPDFRAQQSLSIIANAGFVGISHEGRAYLGMANYYRHQGLGSKVKDPEIAALASARIKERARLLAAIFRVLYLFSASQPGAIPRLDLVPRNGGFEFRVPADIADLCGERPGERLAQLAKESGKTIELAIV